MEAWLILAFVLLTMFGGAWGAGLIGYVLALFLVGCFAVIVVGSLLAPIVGLKRSRH